MPEETEVVEEVVPKPDAPVHTGKALTDTTSPVELPELLLPDAPGTAVKTEGAGTIDYSNITDGYVMAQYTEPVDKKIKAQVKGPLTTYTYNMVPERWETFPLSDGNGEYTVTIYENIEESKYFTVRNI